MAFEIVKKLKSGGRNIAPETRSIRIARYKSDNGARIHVSNMLATELGWKAGTKVAVYIGSGEDEGHIMLRQANAGFFFRRANKSKQSDLIFTVRRIFSEGDNISLTDCRFNIFNGSVYFEIPSRFRANKQSHIAPSLSANLNGSSAQANQ
jgi:hypothetical protein